MNDEEFMIRELAICIIGRLSILNPAYIMPSLRVTLMQLLIELEHSGMGRNKEQASRLLGHLVANSMRKNTLLEASLPLTPSPLPHL